MSRFDKGIGVEYFTSLGISYGHVNYRNFIRIRVYSPEYIISLQWFRKVVIRIFYSEAIFTVYI